MQGSLDGSDSPEQLWSRSPQLQLQVTLDWSKLAVRILRYMHTCQDNLQNTLPPDWHAPNRTMLLQETEADLLYEMV